MAAGELPRRIHRLPDHLVNQIAAGEVIERPASVVKELLENSIDAGATRISVEIKAGGSQLIRVQDDGHGIHADDLVLATDRHTTSKLRTSADLGRITSLGFRGEALSSIAAVSRFSVTSRTGADQHGWSWQGTAGGTRAAVQPAPHPPGTTIEVRDLFYNTPARRKFLRAEKTEFIHIQELCKRMALSRPHLSLRLLHNDRQIFQLTDDSRQPGQRVALFLGRRFLASAQMVDASTAHMGLRGWLGTAGMARSQTDQQFFLLNGRIMRDKFIQHAVRLAYQDRLYPGRHPVYVLYLEMDPGDADINVHPAKYEVRFREARNVHDFIYGSLNKILNAAVEPPLITLDHDVDAGADRIHEPAQRYLRSEPAPVIRQSSPVAGSSVIFVDGRYLLASDAGAILLIDTFRARELIAGLRLKTALAEHGRIPSRPVLVPLSLPLTPVEVELIDHQQALLGRLGLVINPAGPALVMIRELPVLLAYADAIVLVRDVIQALGETLDSARPADDLARLMARHVNDCVPRTLPTSELQAMISDLQRLRPQFPASGFNTVYRRLDQSQLQDLLNHES